LSADTLLMNWEKGIDEPKRKVRWHKGGKMKEKRGEGKNQKKHNTSTHRNTPGENSKTAVEEQIHRIKKSQVKGTVVSSQRRGTKIRPVQILARKFPSGGMKG